MVQVEEHCAGGAPGQAAPEGDRPGPGRAKPLLAPHQGGMARTIHESLTGTVRYQLYAGHRVLLNRTSSRASFEGMWL